VFFRFRFSGKGNVPTTGPVLIVSNHQSNLDPVLVGLACPRQLKYLARKGLFFFPFNLWIRALGAFPIDREKGAIAGIRTALNLLKQNNALVVFPEGSRTNDGKLQEMLPGFCLLARKSGATIVPAAIDGAFAALPRGSALVRPHRIKLAFDAALTPSQYEQLTDAELTQIVANRIERTFQRLQRDEVERQIAVDSAAKPANRLLASSRERALTTEKSI
jgi:1-acyl-sn-glycerol-3-phosphate acyltransferase